MASSSSSVSGVPSTSSIIESILRSSPKMNSFETLSLPLTDQNPSVIRQKFLKLSLKVHPDKSTHHQSKEAFQILSSAFEILYDVESQKQHLQTVLLQAQQRISSSFANDDEDSKKKTKKRKTNHSKNNNNWKEKKRQKKANEKSGDVWTAERPRSWEDVVKELRRLEELERGFVRRKSDERYQRKIMGMIWKAMKVCRILDERAGCPSTFVNGLWSPLYEQEVLTIHRRSLPENWEIRWTTTTYDNDTHSSTISEPIQKRLYRYTLTGEEYETHPSPEVEALIEKARIALKTNKSSFHEEPRLFLNEIIEYLRDDHEYKDMDYDMMELEEEEKARENNNNNKDGSSVKKSKHQQPREYDY